MVEIMIAATVLVVSVGGSVISQMTARNLARTASETSLAVDEIHNAMEEILARPRALIVDPDGFSPEGVPVASYTNRVLDDEVIVARYPGYVAGAPLPDVLDVRVTISWTTFDRRQRSLTLRGSTSR